MPKHRYLMSQWQLEKRVSPDRLLDRMEWLLDLKDNKTRQKKIKGLEELDIEQAIENTADAILRTITDVFHNHIELSIRLFFDEYGGEPKSNPPTPPVTDKNWKVCPDCGNPAYFRTTHLNYRCTKGHLIERADMPGDEFHQSDN